MSVRNHYHTINAKDILASIFNLSRKEQREFALNLLIDLAVDDVSKATTDISRDIISKTNTFRSKLQQAGTKGQLIKHSKIQLEVSPAWDEEVFNV